MCGKFRRWPKTVFVRAFADAIQHAHEDFKLENKHVSSAIILVTQVQQYLCYFSL